MSKPRLFAGPVRVSVWRRVVVWGAVGMVQNSLCNDLETSHSLETSILTPDWLVWAVMFIWCRPYRHSSSPSCRSQSVDRGAAGIVGRSEESLVTG